METFTELLYVNGEISVHLVTLKNGTKYTYTIVVRKGVKRTELVPGPGCDIFKVCCLDQQIYCTGVMKDSFGMTCDSYSYRVRFAILFDSEDVARFGKLEMC